MAYNILKTLPAVIQTALGLKQNTPRVVTSSTQASIDEVLHVTATSTISDPDSPTEGKGFTVIVRNGTATVGGTAYSVAGTEIKRIYQSASYVNYVKSAETTVGTSLVQASDAASVRNAAGATAGVFPANVVASAGTSAAGVVPGIGGVLPDNAPTVRQLSRMVTLDIGNDTPAVTGSGNSAVAAGSNLQSCIDQTSGTTAGSTAERLITMLGNTGGAQTIPGPVRFSFRFHFASFTANGITRVFLGGTQATAALAAAGFGFEVRNTRVWLVAHNGTTLTSLDTGFDCNSSHLFDITLSAGSVVLTSFNWSTQVTSTIGTISGGPAVGAAFTGLLCVGNINGADSAAMRWFYGRNISILF
jgi:hypothetical protein